MREEVASARLPHTLDGFRVRLLDGKGRDRAGLLAARCVSGRRVYSMLSSLLQILNLTAKSG